MRRLEETLRMLLPGLGLKRWLLVVFLGLMQVAVGSTLWLSKWRSHPLVRVATLGFLPRLLRGLLFVGSGTATTYLGWQHLSRSLMRVMLPERPETELTQVLRERQRAATGRRVVVMGAEPGLLPIIRALQSLKIDLNISVILSATDHGPLSQELRDKFGLSGAQILYPTGDDALLYAELEDGRLLEGATTINHYNGGKITDLFLSRDIRRVQVWESDNNGKGMAAKRRGYMPSVSEPALEALAQAELILFAPGRIYTQVLPNLTMPRFAQAVKESPAPKVFVANLMTEPGRTDGWTVADHLEVIQQLAGVTIDYVIVHQGSISTPLLTQYRNEGSGVVRMEPEEATSSLIFADTGEQTTLVEGAVILSGDLVTEAPQIVTFQRGEDTILREMPVVRHDPTKIAPLLRQLLLDEG